MSDRATMHAAEVAIASGDATLQGDLILPDRPDGLVVFAHGSGSSRFSPRNRSVAATLQDANLGTLLFDLLTPEEQAIDEWSGHLRFDIDLLGDRLTDTVDWTARHEATAALPVGLFGASTGAAAALIAAARRPHRVGAVVSRGGRPDLAGDVLLRVRAATLLLVGDQDTPVIRLNRGAAEQMSAPVELRIIAGASHLFEEPGKLDEVARLAGQWFRKHLAAAG